MRMYKAIAAMSENRVIGDAGRIPWHLPEDFRWFKRVTLGHILVMGRRTFESIGRPLPGRDTWILSRTGFTAPGTRTFRDVEALDQAAAPESREVFVAGGAEIYARLLPRCGDLFLTRVLRSVSGDAYFPPFEEQFLPVGILQENPDFRIEHYRLRTPPAP
ncbi:MAG: dihydrofolate reductase [Verrucomicrobiales bacterium]|nr:dihydrofolate reductase [Verrucomicrobiales bacterium]